MAARLGRERFLATMVGLSVTVSLAAMVAFFLAALTRRFRAGRLRVLTADPGAEGA